jgi:glycosyltransferase involved in cell wall biosynthesis
MSRILIGIDTCQIGGPGKGLLQFLRCGGLELCEPVVISTRSRHYGNWPFAEAISKLDVTFEVLRQRLTYDPFLIPQAYRVLRKYRIQILQSHGYKMHLLFFILKLMTGLPWVAYVHGWTAETFRIKLYILLDKFLLRFADRIVVVSEGLKCRLHPRWIDPRKIITITNAIEDIDDPAIHPVDTCRSSDDELLTGVIGRFSPEKGQIYFIEAMAIVARAMPNVKALLIGDGQDRPQLEQRVQELGLTNQVVFTGFQDDVAAYYQTLDLIVLPSLSEGMPNVALEAMAFGKPVVATDVGGVAEVVVNNVTGKLVPAQNPQLLAKAILELLGDKKLMSQLGIAGKQRVKEQFDPFTRAKKMAGVYAQVRFS